MARQCVWTAQLQHVIGAALMHSIHFNETNHLYCTITVSHCSVQEDCSGSSTWIIPLTWNSNLSSCGMVHFQDEVVVGNLKKKNTVSFMMSQLAQTSTVHLHSEMPFQPPKELCLKGNVQYNSKQNNIK